MKIGFFRLGLGNSIVRTIFSSMYQSFFDALRKKGYEVELIFEYQFSDVDALVVPFGEGQENESVKAIVQFGGPVIIYTTPANNWFRSDLMLRWRHRILFVYTPDASQYSIKCYQSVGLPHLHLPFGSDETQFTPLDIPKKYDILFVANAWSGTGRKKFLSQLIDQCKKKGWKLMLFGGGWEDFGYPQQLIAHGDLLNVVYQSSKININLFNEEQNIQDRCLDSNNRLFDLAMGGCFQVCNAPAIVSNYFDKEEVIAIEDSKDWLEAIEYYLGDEKARDQLTFAARERALRDHTWINRAEDFGSALHEYLPGYEEKKPDSGIWNKVQRKTDYILPSTFPIKNKARKLMGRLIRR